MIPYAATFLLSYALVYAAERVATNNRKNNKKLGWLFIILAAIVLSMLGALRDRTIGTDVMTYVDRCFQYARNSASFKGFSNLLIEESVEPLYLFMNYIVAKITSNVRVWYFVISFWDALFVFAFLWENRFKASMLWGTLTYTLMFYNVTFNAVRQSMALCVVLYSFNAARDKKLRKFIILMVIAILIHRSTMLMLITYPLMRIFEGKNTQQKDGAIIKYTIIAAIALVFVNIIVGVLIRIGIFPVKFSHYIGDQFSISRFSVFLFALPMVYMMLMHRKRFYQLSEANAVMFLYVFFWALTAQLDSVSDQFGRLAYGFMIANISLYSQMPYLTRVTRTAVISQNIKIEKCGILLFLIAYWFVCFAVWGTGQTYPYVFG